MGFGRAALAATLVAVGLAGCGSGTSQPKSGSAPLEFHDGFAKLDVPLSERYVEPAAGGHWVFVYGGTGRHEETFDDGALYDVTTQQWVAVPKAPFAEPLWSRGAVWDGRNFVVLGTPCADAHTSDENPDGIRCGHTQPVAAAFDPTTKRWRSVAVPPLRDMTPSGYVLFPDPLGVADGRATFLLTPPDLATPTQIVAVAPGAEPRRITPPPEAKQHCTLGDHLFAFGTGDESVIPTPAGRVDPTHTWRYRAGTWIEGGGIGPSTSPTYGPMGGRTQCTPSAIGYVGLAGTDGLRSGGQVEWFDADGGWRRLPDLEPGQLSAVATVAEHADQPLVWIGDRISVLQNGVWNNRATSGYEQLFPSDTPSVSVAGGTLPSIVAPPALAAVDRYLVGRPQVRSEQVMLAFLDPEQLPPTTPTPVR